MCRHRAADRWFRIWERFTIAWLAVFAALESIGMAKAGEDGAYTAFWRRVLGQLEPCRHSWLGRALIVAICGWCAAHLGWGKFGVAPRKSPIADRPAGTT